MAGPRGARIGVAVGPEQICAVLLNRKSLPVARVSVALDPDGKEDGAQILPAFSELKSQLEASPGVSTQGAQVFVSLLPPLADARMVSLPPLRPAEVEAVVTRDVDRYFLGVKRPRVVGVRTPRLLNRQGSPSAGSTISVLAMAAPLWLLEAIRSAVESVGWQIRAFSPAHGAWIQAAGSRKGAEADAVAAVVGSIAHVIRLEGGNPVAVRQIPASDSRAVAEALGPGKAMVFSGPQEFESLRRALAGHGSEATRDPEGWAGAEEGTAGWAGSSRVELVPPLLQHERREKRRRVAVGMTMAAAALIVASLAASLWGVNRELAAVQARRTSIREQVAPLLAARDSLEVLRAQVHSLEDLSRESPVWTRSLVELAALLPRDTYLTGLFASGDTLEIEAAGSRAGEAIQTLREAGLFQEVRLLGLVERELEAGETVIERFRLWARIPGVAADGGGS